MRWNSFLFLVLLLQALPCWSADRFEEQWRQQRTNLPDGTSFEIATPSKRYILGEPIRLRLTFRSEKAGAYGVDHVTQDRIGRVNGLDQFVIDRASQMDDPLHDRLGEIGGMGGLRGPSWELDEEPVSVELTLNDWVRFKRPGKYRLYIRTERLLHRKPKAAHPLDLWQRPTVAVASNILELELIAPPPGWESQQIAAAIPDLQGPPIAGHEQLQRQRQAVDILRCIDNPRAVRALFAHITAEHISNDILMGLYGSRHDTLIRKELERMMADPEQAIHPAHLDLLSAVSIPRRSFLLNPVTLLTPPGAHCHPRARDGTPRTLRRISFAIGGFAAEPKRTRARTNRVCTGRPGQRAATHTRLAG